MEHAVAQWLKYAATQPEPLVARADDQSADLTYVQVFATVRADELDHGGSATTTSDPNVGSRLSGTAFWGRFRAPPVRDAV